jgi:ribokinase
MDAAGLDLRHVDAEPGEQTLYSFCFVYPDSSGGNLTVDDSACARVDPDFIRRAEADFAAFADGGLALALPEVPLAARAELLELGTRHGFFRAASFLSAEMAEVRSRSLLDKVDLLAVNVDEARALIGLCANPAPEQVAAAAVETLQHHNPRIQLSMTAGSQGSWTWDGSSLTHLPAYTVPVASTAGAGDAHLAGMLVGLVVGLSLSHAQELGALVAALSVTSPHTINFAVSRQSLARLAESMPASLSSAVRALLTT